MGWGTGGAAGRACFAVAPPLLPTLPEKPVAVLHAFNVRLALAVRRADVRQAARRNEAEVEHGEEPRMAQVHLTLWVLAMPSSR